MLFLITLHPKISKPPPLRVPEFGPFLPIILLSYTVVVCVENSGMKCYRELWGMWTWMSVRKNVLPLWLHLLSHLQHDPCPCLMVPLCKQSLGTVCPLELFLDQHIWKFFTGQHACPGRSSTPRSSAPWPVQWKPRMLTNRNPAVQFHALPSALTATLSLLLPSAGRGMRHPSSFVTCQQLPPVLRSIETGEMVVMGGTERDAQRQTKHPLL